MPDSTIELLKRAVDAQAKVLDKPVKDRRELDEEERADRPVVNGRRT